jgi:hypothetical protein
MQNIHMQVARVFNMDMSKLNQIFSRFKFIIWMLPKSPLIVMIRSRTTAAISIWKCDIKDQQVLLSAPQGELFCLYLVTIWVRVRKFYCNTPELVCRAHLHVVLLSASLTKSLSAGRQSMPGRDRTGCYSYNMPGCEWMRNRYLFPCRSLFLTCIDLWFHGCDFYSFTAFVFSGLV